MFLGDFYKDDDLTRQRREKIAQIKEILPEVFEGDRIDMERFVAAFGEDLVDRGEKYGLRWAGKSQSLHITNESGGGSLKFLPEKSVLWEGAENVLIEGDNLQVLNLLKGSYLGKVKMIYIDPPYNTGNNFVYSDAFTDRVEDYLNFTGQNLSFNDNKNSIIEVNGRFHTKWLNMMLPRLYLARNLLREDGIIFISIDDNEVFNLRLVLNEIFSEENFVAQFVRQTVKGGTGPSSTIRVNHDYVLAYAKCRRLFTVDGDKVPSEKLDRADEKGDYRVGRELNKWGADSRREDSPTMWFPIPGPEGEDIYPIRNDGSEGRWRWGKERLLKAAAEGDLIYKKRKDGTYVVYEKVRSESPRRKAYTTLMVDGGTNARGTEELKSLFRGACVLDYPKPTSLIKKLIKIAGATGEDSVMDFFAGSGTTAQAVLDYNIENRTHLKFICIQSPVSTPDGSVAAKMGYGNIMEICRERVKRVIENYRNNKTDDEPWGLGFKFFEHEEAVSAGGDDADREDENVRE